mgnify:CR=1 FL=1
MNVQLVAKTTGVGKYEELNSEEIVSAIARHGIIKEDNGKLIKYLMDNKHVSPLDMINFVFEIETSLSIGRQLLRHASIKPQEHSLRYSKSIGLEPIEFRLEHSKNRQSSAEIIGSVIQHSKISSNAFETIVVDEFIENKGIKVAEKYNEYLGKVAKLLNDILEIYQEGLDLGIAKECARFILPNCTTTIMSFNGTLRSWLTLLNVRCDDHAQKECRIIANLIGEELEKEMPNIFSTINWRTGMFM